MTTKSQPKHAALRMAWQPRRDTQQHCTAFIMGPNVATCPSSPLARSTLQLRGLRFRGTLARRHPATHQYSFLPTLTDRSYGKSRTVRAGSNRCHRLQGSARTYIGAHHSGRTSPLYLFAKYPQRLGKNLHPLSANRERLDEFNLQGCCSEACFVYVCA